LKAEGGYHQEIHDQHMSTLDSAAFDFPDRNALPNLAASLHADSSTREQATAECIAFVLSDTKGHRHNRIRALMCRRLKHCLITDAQGRLLVQCITGRLASGDFSQQFRDQLSLAIHLDTRTTYECAVKCLAAPKVYVRKMAAWTIENIEKRARNGLVGNRPIPPLPTA
jgi:hypothetical protein